MLHEFGRFLGTMGEFVGAGCNKIKPLGAEANLLKLNPLLLADVKSLLSAGDAYIDAAILACTSSVSKYKMS
jgi:hypothetical protein